MGAARCFGGDGIAIAPAAPAAASLSYVAVGLLAFVAFVVCLGLRAAWEHTFHILFQGIADAHIPIRFVSDVHPFRFVGTLDRTVLNALGTAAKKSEHTMGYFFHGAAVLLGWTAREVRDLSAAVLHWATWIENAHLPKWTKAMIYAAFPPALLARLIRAAIHANLPHIIRTTVTHSIHTVTHTVVRIAHATTGAVAIPGWVIHLPRRVRTLERDRAHLWRRLRALERYAGAAGAVALFTAALARLGLKWIRCRNVTKAGRAVCRTDASLLESLLGDTLAIVGVISVVEFANGLLAIEDEAVKILGAGIREFPG